MSDKTFIIFFYCMKCYKNLTYLTKLMTSELLAWREYRQTAMCLDYGHVYIYIYVCISPSQVTDVCRTEAVYVRTYCFDDLFMEHLHELIGR
jgi:hypothetical protein